MVDIHSHILYGIDDGAHTIEESLAMLELAAESGITDIVATPHSDLRFRFQPEVMAAQIAELQSHLGDRIRIHRGCDFHLHFDNIRTCLTDTARFTINGKRYLMVEFADQTIPKTIADVFEDMIARDITPVITHPERNKLLMGRIDDMAKWIRLGCLIQVTGASFLGRFGKNAEQGAGKLMARNIVHFVASDAHDTQHRPPDLREPYKHVVSEYGQEIATRLFQTNPAATLTGAEVEYEDPEGGEEKKPRWKFW